VAIVAGLYLWLKPSGTETKKGRNWIWKKAAEKLRKLDGSENKTEIYKLGEVLFEDVAGYKWSESKRTHLQGDGKNSSLAYLRSDQDNSKELGRLIVSMLEYTPKTRPTARECIEMYGKYLNVK
jgi:hypothetical protein